MTFENTFVTFDLETGGLKSGENAVVEVCFLAIDCQLNEIKEYTTLVAPYGEYTIQPQALTANGLTLEQIRGGKDSMTVVQEIESFLKSLKVGREKPILCGHNIDWFDIPFLDEFFKFHKKELSTLVNDKFTIDTMWWSRIMWNESVNYKLATCCENANITLANAHRASTDAKANQELVKFFLKNLRGQGVGSLVKEKRFREEFQF